MVNNKVFNITAWPDLEKDIIHTSFKETKRDQAAELQKMMESK